MNRTNALLLLFSFSVIAGCSNPSSSPGVPAYSLTIIKNPAEGGEISPAEGSYEEGEQVVIRAIAEGEYTFVRWSGDTESLANPDTAITSFAMPAEDIALRALFGREEDGMMIVEIYNPATGQTWMDRNLGASRAAISYDDSEAYGDLYQWGRPADGHEKRTSETTTILSDSDRPGHGDFIVVSDYPYDWRSPQNDDLWQGVDGTNNPCPSGFRIPTIAEWIAEQETWSRNSRYGAFNSPLKLTGAGRRQRSGNPGFDDNRTGIYWASSLYINFANYMFFRNDWAGTGMSGARAEGLSVRCIKDISIP
jgi:uncharacterized protein (TIGR02145 family)